MIKLAGLGNPLLDIIMHCDFETLKSLDAVPDSMNLIDSEYSNRLFALPLEKHRTPGGSCPNTLRGVAWLGNHAHEECRVVSMGAIGRDEPGDNFETILEEQGVISALTRKDVATGTSTILVTPDHKRTMFTHLGACREHSRSDVENESIDAADCVHTTGYMWDTGNQRMAAEYIIDRANETGKTVSYDLADPFVVHRFGGILNDYLPGRIGILFANWEELAAMTDKRDDDAILEAAKRYAPVVVMKTGADGCKVLDHGDVITVPGDKVSAVDTTGAGDSFAAGFLFGMLKGYSMETCAKIANRIASRIVTIEGCNYGQLDFEEVKPVLPV